MKIREYMDAAATSPKKRPAATPGFAIEIKADTELQCAMLLAEDEEGHAEPVACIISINEAREIIGTDMQRRLHALDTSEDPGLCPYEYKVWARGLGGDYRIAATISALEVA